MKLKHIVIGLLVASAAIVAGTITSSDTAHAGGKYVCVTSPCNVQNVPAPSAPVLSLMKSPSLSCYVSPCPEPVNIGWTANPAAEYVKIYEIYRNGTLISTVDSSTLTYEDNVFGTNTSFTYVVRAISTIGDTDSNAVTFYTKTIPDTTAPSTPTNLTSSYVEVNGRWGARLSWNASTDNVAVDHYELTRIDNNTRNIVGFVISGSQTSYNDLMFNINTGAPVNYTYVLQAFDAAGNVSGASNEVNFPPGTTLSASQVIIGTRYGARLTWTAVPNTDPVSYYVITRTDNSGSGISTQFTVAGDVNRYDDLIYNLNTGADVTFYYRITAYDEYGNFMYTSNYATYSNSAPQPVVKQKITKQLYSMPRPK